jgi:hypothetical protein
LRVVTVGTSYDSVLAIFRGTPTDRHRIVCNDDRVGLQAGAQARFVAGTTYLIAVSRLGPAWLHGGPTTLTLYKARPLAVTGFNIIKVVAGELSGRLFATGQFRCTNPAGVLVDVTASQKVGGHVAQASGETFLAACAGRPVTWTSTLFVTNGWAFTPGRAAVDVAADSDDGWTESTFDAPTMYPIVVADPNR